MLTSLVTASPTSCWPLPWPSAGASLLSTHEGEAVRATVFFVLPKPRIPPSIISSHGNHLDHMLLLYSLMPYIETVNGNQQSLPEGRIPIAGWQRPSFLYASMSTVEGYCSG
ncbi:hypothetical protein MRB53_011669 [Persea americana]|uniref:Uncharacterized protein n=1 Tax=Persea americana TaxID=3435 RepID=A0ACC2LVG1_PERAE|nr:hypothetical protein MRB53_011669 [Persea americana]